MTGPTQVPSALEVRDLVGGYGQGRALHGMNFEVPEGQIVTLLGRNGVGKTSTLRAIMGLLPEYAGSIQYRGQELTACPTRTIARSGVAYCPEERAIYSTLTVQENLMLPPVVSGGGMSMDLIHDLFPNLKERGSSQGTKLSGGEQQMLAIARILRTGAKLLLLDEPTEGLAPVVVQQIGRTLALLKEQGYTILLVEQNFNFARQISDLHFVVDTGRVVDRLTADELEADGARIKTYLGA